MKALRVTKPEGLRERLSDMIGAGASISKIAVEAGVPSDIVRAVLDGARPAGLHGQAIEAKLAAWADEFNRPRRDLVEPAWVETPSAKQIENSLEFARATPSIVVIYGGAGVGKSTAARHYVRGHGYDQNKLYVAAGEFNKSPTAILELLADAAGCHGRAYRSDQLARQILERLPEKGAIIVIDEAQHLSAAALDGLRWFHDEGGVGLAYLGNEVVFTKISRGGRRAMFAQLNSRVGMHLQISAPDAADVDAVLEAWGVSGREERSVAQQIANDPGGLRVLTHVLRQARLAALAMDRPMGAALMRGALDARGGAD